MGVRDSAGDNLDFPGSASNVRICPGGISITTGSRTLPAGTYTEFGFWQDTGPGTTSPRTTCARKAAAHAPDGSGQARAAGQARAPGEAHAPGEARAPTNPAPPAKPAPPTTPPAPSAPSAPASPVPGKTLTWSDEFTNPITWGPRWVGATTSAYQYGNHNPNDNKLDWLSTTDVAVANGVATLTAQPSPHTLENGKQAWTTGLLTTEGSTEGFQVKTNDYVETRVQLPTGTGAWPALWTWQNGDDEIDSFEYHPDNPNLLELTNHVNPGAGLLHQRRRRRRRRAGSPSGSLRCQLGGLVRQRHQGLLRRHGCRRQLVGLPDPEPVGQRRAVPPRPVLHADHLLRRLRPGLPLTDPSDGAARQGRARGRVGSAGLDVGVGTGVGVGLDVRVQPAGVVHRAGPGRSGSARRSAGVSVLEAREPQLQRRRARRCAARRVR